MKAIIRDSRNMNVIDLVEDSGKVTTMTVDAIEVECDTLTPDPLGVQPIPIRALIGAYRLARRLRADIRALIEEL